MIQKRFFARAIPLVAIVFAALSLETLAGCVSAPKDAVAAAVQEPSVPQKAATVVKDGPFYTENIGDFEYRTLSNGVRLYVKRNAGNRVLNLKIVFRGGASAVPVSKAGLERVTLALLCRGSESYPYEKVLDAQYRSSSSLSASSGYDYSAYELNCIDTYLDGLLDIYLDGLLHPAFDPARFKDVQNELAQAMEARMGDPDQRARFLGTQTIFSGHPYASDPLGIPGSMDSISLEDVKAHYASLLNADRMFVVAVGNYDVDSLVAKLESALGGIPRRGRSPLAPPPAETSGPVVLEAHPASEGVAYIQGYFRIPARTDKDFVPFAIAADMLDDLFFNIIREKYGACYSVGNLLRPASASYGILWIYKASDIEGIKRYEKEAEDMLTAGNLILSKDTSTGQYVLASVADRLPAYRNKYINSVFANQKTNADIAAQIARSVVYANDPTDYLRTPDRITAVTPADIQRVYKAWFLDQSFRWVVVSDEAGLKRVPVAEYGDR